LVLVRHRAEIWQRHRRQAGNQFVSFGAWRLQKPRPPSPLCPFAVGHGFLLARKLLVRWRERPAGSRLVKNQANSGTRTAVIKKKLMKNKNLRKEPAPANADLQSSKALALATLAEFRRLWRALNQQGANPDVLAGLKCGASLALRHIERETPEWELWTTLPDEAELTSQSRTGDHLAVTRRLMGFPV